MSVNAHTPELTIAPVMLGGGNEVNTAMTMLLVVPDNEVPHPDSCGLQALKAILWLVPHVAFAGVAGSWASGFMRSMISSFGFTMIKQSIAGFSSDGRASVLHAECRGFDPCPATCTNTKHS